MEALILKRAIVRPPSRCPSPLRRSHPAHLPSAVVRVRLPQAPRRNLRHACPAQSHVCTGRWPPGLGLPFNRATRNVHLKGQAGGDRGTRWAWPRHGAGIMVAGSETGATTQLLVLLACPHAGCGARDSGGSRGICLFDQPLSVGNHRRALAESRGRLLPGLQVGARAGGLRRVQGDLTPVGTCGVRRRRNGS